MTAAVQGDGALFSFIFCYDLSDPRNPRKVMETPAGTEFSVLLEGDRTIVLGTAPGELDIRQPRDVILSPQLPKELQQ